MSITPPALVASAPRPALPFGLFSVIQPRVGSADRWEGGGIQLEELGCPPTAGAGYIGPWDCGGDTEGLPKGFDGNATLSEAAQFTVYQSEVCTPTGNSIDRSREIAEGRLELFEELLVERALWARLEAEAAQSVEITLGMTKAEGAQAVAELEVNASLAYGSQGIVHIPRAEAGYLLAIGVLEKRQTRLFTSLDTPVVAGSGYVSSGHLAYWTPQLVAYRTETFYSQQQPVDLLDRAQNNLYAVAERSWVIGFDTNCGVAIEPEPVTIDWPEARWLTHDRQGFDLEPLDGVNYFGPDDKTWPLSDLQFWFGSAADTPFTLTAEGIDGQVVTNPISPPYVFDPNLPDQPEA